MLNRYLNRSVVNKLIETNKCISKIQCSIRWGIINALALICVLWLRSSLCVLRFTYLQYIANTITVLLLINTVFHFSRFLVGKFQFEKVDVTKEQLRFLDANEEDWRFKVKFSSTPVKRMEISFNASEELILTKRMSSKNSTEDASWVSFAVNQRTSPHFSSIPNSFLSSDNSASFVPEHFDTFGEHWQKDLAMRRRTVYQSSPVLDNNELNESSMIATDKEIYTRFSVNTIMLATWTEKLRMWISKTILERLVDQITNANETLTALGMGNTLIGEVGLQRLKKTAKLSAVSDCLPSFSAVIQFLEVSPYQEYLVQRIKALARGGCLSEYRWNSGGTFQGKPWTEQLPTDAALVMHLLATYLDCMLFPAPHITPGRRPFSTRHLVIMPAPLDVNKEALIVYQQHINPPHYQLVIGNEIFDVTKGRNNLFHAISLMLYYIKCEKGGMLEHINLGSSGLNMLCVVNT